MNHWQALEFCEIMLDAYDRPVGRDHSRSCAKYSYLIGKMQQRGMTYRRVLSLLRWGTVACFLAGSFAATPLAAQVVKGSISGTVINPAGGALPNAELTAFDSATGAVLAGAAHAGGFVILRKKGEIGNSDYQEEV
jgi:hypothetical protein